MMPPSLISKILSAPAAGYLSRLNKIGIDPLALRHYLAVALPCILHLLSKILITCCKIILELLKIKINILALFL
jgi:hypothetical protein